MLTGLATLPLPGLPPRVAARRLGNYARVRGIQRQCGPDGLFLVLYGAGSGECSTARFSRPA